jgi:hypothetical protein
MEAIKMSAEDKQLEEIFHGDEKPLHPDTVHITLGKPSQPVKADKKTDSKEPVKEKKTAQKPNKKPMDAEYEPAKTWYDENTVNMVKWVLVFVALEYLFFYWQQTGQMQSSAAVPSMIVCALLAGISVGKNWKWGH